MIKYTSDLHQEFLDRSKMETIQRLSGKEITDTKFVIVNINNDYYVAHRSEITPDMDASKIFPTYTLSELLYKLPEWLDNYKSLEFCKDAPFYMWGYYGNKGEKDNNFVMERYDEFPIESAASLLIACYQNENVRKLIPSDISGKWDIKF